MSNDISLLDTDVESSLRATLRDMLADRCPFDDVVRAFDGDRSLTSRLWKTLATDLGLAGLLVAPERGGAGASAREAAVVMEELGRRVAPVPFLTSSVEATTVLMAGESDLLGELACGELIGTLLVPFSAMPTSSLPSFSRGGNGGLTGRVTSVAGALEADVFLVPVVTEEGTEVYAVRAAAVEVERFVCLDETRPLADITLDAAPGDLVVAADVGAAAVHDAMTTGAGLLSAELTGLASWCRDTTVDYLETRRQFGRVLGSFQALKHRLADLFVDVDSASAASRYVAGVYASEGEDAAIATAVAKSYCGDVAVRAAEEAVQLHGGIGMTWEYPVHLHLKRAKADQIGRGLPGHHRAALGNLVDLPAGNSA